jgi:transposase-like protein
LSLQGIDKSLVPRTCKELDTLVTEFRNRPLTQRYPYVWLDAIYLKVRQNGRIVSLAAVIAIGVCETGERHILGLALGAGESEPFWSEFLRSLVQRGLQGVQLVISDAHEGLKATISKVLTGATWQRRRVHTIRTQFRTRRLAAAQVHVTLQWNHMTDLQGILAHYNTVDQQVQESLLLGIREGLKAVADMLAEGSQTL